MLLVFKTQDAASETINLIDDSDELELLAPAPLNVVCFRYVAPNLGLKDLNNLNEKLILKLYEGGNTVPSYTVLADRYAIRVAIVNHRSRRHDLDFFVKKIIELGRKLKRSYATTESSA